MDLATQYRIVVRGRLSERLGSAFRGRDARAPPGPTVLRGRAEASAARELLARLSDLGIEPVRVDADG